jgi:hypothetical protein
MPVLVHRWINVYRTRTEFLGPKANSIYSQLAQNGILKARYVLCARWHIADLELAADLT